MELEVRSPFPGHEVIGERITDQDKIRAILTSDYIAFVIRVASEPVEDKKSD